MNADFSSPAKKYRWLGIAMVICITLISALYQTERVGAVAVTTDYAFGTNGAVQTDISGYRTAPFDMTIQSDGKIVVAGTADTASGPGYFTVTRYNPDGSLDSSFDGDGILTGQFRITSSYTSSYGRSVSIQTDGKIVVAGDSYLFENNQGTTDFGVARLNPDGSFDNSFDGDGRVNFSAATTQYDQASLVAIQPSGKIVLSGNVGNGVNTFAPALARLNPNGSLDTTFFEDGVVDYIGIYSYPAALYVQPDGKINFVTNPSNPTPDTLTTFLRFNEDGSPDMTFGTGGRRSTGALGGVNSIGFQPDGRIILGSANSVVRLNADYSLDTSFGNNGGATVSFGQFSSWLNDMAVQPDGKIVVAGFTETESGSGGPCDFALARFNANGTLDTTFDLDGKIVASVGSRIERAEAVRVLPNGKILIVGKAGSTTVVGKETLMRFMGDINTADFDGDTKTDVSVWRPATGVWYLLQSASGYNAVNWGLDSDKLVPGDYTGDGRTDIAVFRPSIGDWFVLRSENSTLYSVHFGAAEDLPTQADFDGDGKTDIAIFRPSTRVWYRINSLSGGISQLQFGTGGDVPVIGDFDGDGRSDMNIFRPSNSTFYRLNSSNGEFSSIQFGTGGDVPVSADFNGDSKTDIAVFRPSNGVWYWLRSSDGSFQAIQWGQNGDVPTAADFDGDGKADFAVFRPASGTWYLNRSQLGYVGIQFGQNGDQPIPNVAVP